MGLWLVWERTGSRSRRVLDKPLTVGRDPSCSIRLEDPTVSRRHAVVSVVAGQVVVDAAGSANGIVLESGRVEKLSLLRGQSFRIADTTFRVVQAPVPQLATSAEAWPPPNGQHCVSTVDRTDPGPRAIGATVRIIRHADGRTSGPPAYGPGRIYRAGRDSGTAAGRPKLGSVIDRLATPG
jgi:hypothetical protein